MDQFTYLLIAFTVLLCLAVLVIILLNQRVRRLQKDNIKPAPRNLHRSLGKEETLNEDGPRWQPVEPLEVAKQIYETGITNLN